MSTYTLNNSAGDIDSALQKVVAATTTPTDGSPLMVTSGGVKAYVDTQDTALETQILANTAAIAGNAGSGVKTAKLTASNGNSSSNSNVTFPLTVSSDPDSIVSVTNSVVTLPNAGTYLVGFSGQFKVYGTYYIEFYRNNSEIYKEKVQFFSNNAQPEGEGVSFSSVFVETAGTTSFYLYADEEGQSAIEWTNVSMYVIKLA